MAATWTGTLWQCVLGTSWQSSYGTWSMFLVRKDQIIFFLFHFNLHRMLYGDVMAMFLGINLTVLVVAIPGKLSLWHIHIGMERAAIEIRTRDTLSHGEPCISFCTGFHTWSCNGSCSMACIPVKSPVFSWNWLTTCFFFNIYRLTLFIVLCCIVRVALWDVRSMALGKMVVNKKFLCFNEICRMILNFQSKDKFTLGWYFVSWTVSYSVWHLYNDFKSVSIKDRTSK